jgi:GDP-L-fucose synthase
MAVMPTNLYGPGDNYDLNNSHVLPALMRKMHEAKQRGDSEVVVWGTGRPRREFLYSEDMADACLYLLEQAENKLSDLFNEERPPLVNIGYGEDLTIRELAQLITGVVGFSGKLVFDSTKPDGTMRKLMDVSRLKNLGWTATTSLRDGILAAYESYLTKAK